MLAAVITAALATFLAGYVVLDVVFGRTPVQRRLGELKLFTVRGEVETIPWTRRAVIHAGRRIEHLSLLVRLAARSEPLLDRLGGNLRPTEWLAVRLFAAGGVGLLGAVLLDVAIGLPVGLLAGFFGANAVLRSRIGRREQAFADELPGALNLMTSSLRSGFTLHQAVEAAVRDDDGPVATELRRALSESRLGDSFEDALERVGDRMRSSEMVWLVMALRLQREVGGSLVDVMQTTADTMRERAYLHRHVRALSGEGRISAYVLTAMPIVSALMIYLTDPEYLKPLVTQPLGMLMLSIAVGSLCIGALWLRVVVRVDV
jgi:tight adherence protein B